MFALANARDYHLDRPCTSPCLCYESLNPAVLCEARVSAARVSAPRVERDAIFVTTWLHLQHSPNRPHSPRLRLLPSARLTEAVLHVEFSF